MDELNQSKIEFGLRVKHRRQELGMTISQTMKKIYIRLASKDKEDNKKAVTDFFSATANS